MAQMYFKWRKCIKQFNVIGRKCFSQCTMPCWNEGSTSLTILDTHDLEIIHDMDDTSNVG